MKMDSLMKFQTTFQVPNGRKQAWIFMSEKELIKQ